MNSILAETKTTEPKSSIENSLENYTTDFNLGNHTRQATGIGTICIACALAAIGLGWFNAELYFLLVLVAAVFALLGYFEIGAIGKSRLSGAFQIFAGIIFISLIVFLMDSAMSVSFLVLYAVFSTLIPLLMTIFALTTNKIEVWKSLTPLSVPAFHIAAGMANNPKSSTLIYLSIPFAWALVGFAAYLGRR